MEEFGTITVFGRLEFLDGADRHLRCHNLLIRGGELLIGKQPYTYIDDNGDEQSVDAVPFENEAQITLLGGFDDEYLTVNSNIETGNKNIIVGGALNMVGKTPSVLRTRLTEEAEEGATSICV